VYLWGGPAEGRNSLQTQVNRRRMRVQRLRTLLVFREILFLSFVLELGAMIITELVNSGSRVNSLTDLLQSGPTQAG
jgi:hypothetical protein